MNDGQNDPKKDWEIAKLRAETAKIKRESLKLKIDTRQIFRTYSLEIIKSFATTITAIVALLGLYITVSNQQREFRRQEETRRDDTFAATIKQFGEAKEDLAQVTAINSLSVFGSDEKYRQRVRDLLLQSVPFIRNESSRLAMRQALINQADKDSLLELIKQNRSLQERIRNRVGNKFEAATLDTLQELAEDYRDEVEQDFELRVLAWPNIWSESDNSLKELLDDLDWNIDTLVGSINRLKEIKDIDMSDITFSRLGPSGFPKVEQGVPTFGDPVNVKGISYFDSDLKFINVNMSKAVLAGAVFRQATFQDVNLDSTILYKTDFTNSIFSGNTSLKGFRSWTSILQKEGIKLKKPIIERSYINGPVWKNCKLLLTGFSPELPDHVGGTVPDGTYFTFDQSSWVIQKLPTEFLKKELLPPATGEQSTFEGTLSP